MNKRKNPITCNIDFNKDGIQHGFLKLPYSHNLSAWGSIMIPICQIKNGNGPTALLSAANHGDEYEGVVALLDFISKLDAQNNINQFNGRVIIIPMMNYPAFKDSARVSPIDDANLNRSFPGKPDGSITQIIAHYFSHTLLPMSDYVLDIHSGGKTLHFLPFAASHKLNNQVQDKKCTDAMLAFNAPYYLKILEIDALEMYDTEAEKQGKVFITTELGGSGTTTPETLEIAKNGVWNFLVHSGVFNAKPTISSKKPISLDMDDFDCYNLSYDSGILEPCTELGNHINKGDLIAKIYRTDRTGLTPTNYYANLSGLVIAKYIPSIINIGDPIIVTAKIISL